ncbi:major paralogous domain-containing protein [Fibrobacter sp. UWCM]|uniref:fibrobacter succinogenes major paralogous domain-containing protein n=1 Tax=Fibrobacter sp. UWCM TaxID=1896208 RepID=UPI000921647F|nr:fibrobacter succinogenes major paralogous domain-containing protein [Fibrobacter sp. UWCM]SHH88404.1 major paralogous domain-containing protein [Fibrobacter sp. UWCM]
MKKSFQRVIATLNLFQGKHSLTIFLLAAFFALSACDDSSSAGDDDNNVILSGDSREESCDSRSNDKDEAISSSGKSNDPAEVTDDSSDSKDNPSSAGTSTKSSNSNTSGNDAKSSSSAGKEVSSSSEEMKTAWDYLNPDIDYGEFTDERDGQVYKTVKIGDQVWMAQNLNYAYIDVPYNFSYYGNVYISDSTSWCYDNDPANCAKYGRLYTWAAAIDSVKLATDAVNPQDCGYGHLCSALNGIVKGICPSGWHLPQKSEWDTLFTAVSDGSTAVGNKFKSLSGWLSDRNGDDDFGFSALPAGLYGRGGSFDNVGKMAFFWSSVMYDFDTVYGVRLFSNNVVSRDEVGNYKYMGFSVRCVKDSE